MNIKLVTLTSLVCISLHAMDHPTLPPFSVQEEIERQLSLVEAITFLDGRLEIQEPNILFRHYQNATTYMQTTAQVTMELKNIVAFLQAYAAVPDIAEMTKNDRRGKLRALINVLHCTPQTAVTQFPVLDKFLCAPSSAFVVSMYDPIMYAPCLNDDEEDPRDQYPDDEIYDNRAVVVVAIKNHDFDMLKAALEKSEESKFRIRNTTLPINEFLTQCLAA